MWIDGAKSRLMLSVLLFQALVLVFLSQVASGAVMAADGKEKCTFTRDLPRDDRFEYAKLLKSIDEIEKLKLNGFEFDDGRLESLSDEFKKKVNIKSIKILSCGNKKLECFLSGVLVVSDQKIYVLDGDNTCVYFWN